MKSMRSLGRQWRNEIYLSLVYPFFERQKYRGMRKRIQRYAQLEKLSLDENREIQWRAVRRLLQHAYASSSFYRQRFDSACVRIADIQTPADLTRIPPLTRDDIRNHFAELCSNRYRPEELLQAATGGTTDTPVLLARSIASVREKIAVQLLFHRWAGYLPGDKVFFLWGARVDFVEHPSWRWRLYDRYLMQRIYGPTSLFNDEVLESYRQMLNRFRPKIIYAYPTPLALFCEFLRNSGRPFHRPLSAICTAEPLLDTQRRVIESALECPVFEFYGSRDFGAIAAECEFHTGLHLNPASAYLELVPVKGAQSDGLHEILVTDLLNDGMPLIRYKINDCTHLGSQSCPCGRGFPLIQRITGRTVDNFILPNGDQIPGVALTNRVLKVCPGLKKVQVIQETIQDFHVRYVPGEAFSSDDLDLLRQNLAKFFPPGLAWTFEEVADIERERSGKTRFCISHVTKFQNASRLVPEGAA